MEEQHVAYNYYQKCLFKWKKIWSVIEQKLHEICHSEFCLKTAEDKNISESEFYK